jgi:hypothetical protein
MMSKAKQEDEDVDSDVEKAVNKFVLHFFP